MLVWVKRAMFVWVKKGVVVMGEKGRCCRLEIRMICSLGRKGGCIVWGETITDGRGHVIAPRGNNAPAVRPPIERGSDGR